MVPIIQAARSLGLPVDLVQSEIDRGQLRAAREPVAATSQSDVLAAQAAVLLAKTQAAASRLQSQDFFRRMRDADNAAEADRQARQDADHALAQADRALEQLRRDQAVAEAKVHELRKQLANDDRHFQFMVDRITSLESERQRLSQCLGWLGRLRYRRMLQNPRPQQGHNTPPPGSENHEIDLTDADSDQQTSYPPPEPVGRQSTAPSDALTTVQNVEPLA